MAEKDRLCRRSRLYPCSDKGTPTTIKRQRQPLLVAFVNYSDNLLFKLRFYKVCDNL